jgi:mannose-6-phosphate isomerase-like protein (cupin superfamily)
MEEIYFVASGTGVMQVDDEKQQVNPGDAIWIPEGSAHSLVNNSHW